MSPTNLRDFLHNRRALVRITTSRSPASGLATPSNLPMLASLSRSVMDLVGVVRSGVWRWSGEEPTWEPAGDLLTKLEALPHDPHAVPERVAATLETLDDLEDLKWSLLELAESFDGVPTPKIAVLPPGDDDFFDDDEEVVPADRILGRLRVDDQAFAVTKGLLSVEAVDLLWPEVAGDGAAWAVRPPKPPRVKQPNKKPAIQASPPPSPARLAAIAEAAGKGRLRAARICKTAFATVSSPRPTDGAVHLVAVSKRDRAIARRAVVYPATGATRDQIADEVASAFGELFARVETAVGAPAAAGRE